MSYLDELDQLESNSVEHFSIESEQSVIGALLQGESDTFTRISGKVCADDFFKSSHKEIFAVIEQMHRERLGIDLVTVGEKLSDRLELVGGLAYLNDLYGNTPTTANAPAYAKFVRDYSLKRKALSIAGELQRNIEDESAIPDAIRSLMTIDNVEKNHSYNIKEVMLETCDAMQDAMEGRSLGIQTGLKDLDGLTGGMFESDLIVVGGRPSHGKTAFALNLMNNCNVAAGFISTEQPAVQIGMRLMAINGKLNAHDARTGKLKGEDWARVTGAVTNLQEKKIFINDESSPSLDTVINQARQWKHEQDIKILFIDYIQRIHDARKGDDGLRLEIRRIVMALKTLARELNIPVVALAQVKRAVDERANKRPFMGDLMESGAIEAEADVIVTLYRDEVYDPETSDKGTAEILICKNRAGQTGMVRTAWIGHALRFENFDYTGYKKIPNELD